MEFKETIKVRKKEFERVNKLLKIPDIDDLTEDDKLLEPKSNDSIHIAEVNFEDDTNICIRVNSGKHCYYDEYIVSTEDGRVVEYESEFTIDKQMEFALAKNRYIVKLELV